MQDDRLSLAIEIVKVSNTHTGKYLTMLISSECPSMTSLIEKVHAQIANSESSRCLIYKEINPSFNVQVVCKTKHVINEFHHIAYTQFGVSGDNLAIETGRWNRRGRGHLPVEDHLCRCGQIQTERHVVEDCLLTENIRSRYNIVRLEDLFTDGISDLLACKIIHDILEVYK